MTATPNAFKAALAESRPQIGLWCALVSNVVAEILNPIGYDWILFDSEHAPNEPSGLLSQLQAMRGSGSEPVVRPPWNDAVIIKRLLDIGFRSFLMPMVQTAEEARAAVAATRYPPAGVRGVATINRAASYGADASYFANADRQMCVIVQIETGKSLDNLEEICAVEGVDGIFLGPSDLAASMGHLGKPNTPAVQDAIRHVAEVARAHGKAAGTLAPVQDDARRYIGWGYSFVAVGADVGLLRTAAGNLLKAFK